MPDGNMPRGADSFRKFTPGQAPLEDSGGAGFWAVFQGDAVLISPNGDSSLLPRAQSAKELGIELGGIHYVGELDGVPCRAARAEDTAQAPEGLVFAKHRAVFTKVPAAMYRAMGAARQVLDWDLKNRFCGSCGKPMEDKPGERARFCPACNIVRYPRVSPAVIMRITRGREILLGRQAIWPQGMYSVLAGFVEPGENAEEAVIREVREEAGIEVGNVRYFASQPWALPDSLMLGFTAEYVSGELLTDSPELEKVGWYSPENMPGTPRKGTISSRLIADYLAKFA